MKNKLCIFAGAIMLTVSGCADPGDGTSTGEHNRMVKACLATTNHERPMCECVADKARKELTPQSFDMLLATFEEDKERAIQLRRQLSLEETMQASKFSMSAFAQCARAMVEE